jgi:hypothetical protein
VLQPIKLVFQRVRVGIWADVRHSAVFLRRLRLLIIGPQ